MMNRVIMAIKLLIPPLVIAAILISFIFVYRSGVGLFLWGISLIIIFPSMAKILNHRLDFDRSILDFLSVPEKPEGLNYIVIKEYISSVSSIAFSFSVIVFGNKIFEYHDNTWMYIPIGVYTGFLLLYCGFCLLEFIYKSVGRGSVIKTIIVGLPALSLQIAFLAVGIEAVG